jgi:hypothetical protein
MAYHFKIIFLNIFIYRFNILSFVTPHVMEDLIKSLKLQLSLNTRDNQVVEA